jgi:hypothetical protein
VRAGQLRGAWPPSAQPRRPARPGPRPAGRRAGPGGGWLTVVWRHETNRGFAQERRHAMKRVLKMSHFGLCPFLQVCTKMQPPAQKGLGR